MEKAMTLTKEDILKSIDFIVWSLTFEEKAILIAKLIASLNPAPVAMIHTESLSPDYKFDPSEMDYVPNSTSQGILEEPPIKPAVVTSHLNDPLNIDLTHANPLIVELCDALEFDINTLPSAEFIMKMHVITDICQRIYTEIGDDQMHNTAEVHLFLVEKLEEAQKMAELHYKATNNYASLNVISILLDIVHTVMIPEREDNGSKMEVEK